MRCLIRRALWFGVALFLALIAGAWFLVPRILDGRATLPGAQGVRPERATPTQDAGGQIPKTAAEDFLFRGRPAKHWRGRIKQGEISYGAWTGLLWIPDGEGQLILPDTNAAEGLPPLLIELMKDSDPFIREFAAYGLGTYGRGRWQAPSTAALTDAVRGKDSFLRWQAALSLERINPKLDGRVAKEVAEVLKQGEGMEHISYGASDMTDADMTKMRRWANLRGLNAGGTKITDAGLANLSGLTRLVDLDISSTKVTDAGLAHLKTVSSLNSLDVSHTCLTDAGLAHLRALTHLERLKVVGTSVTEAGIQELRKSLPNLKAVR